MNNYLPYIFGTSTLLAGIYLFLVSFGIYKPKKLDNNESLIEKYGTFIKIISIIMILRGGYNLLNPDPNRYKIGENKVNDLKEKFELKDILVKKC